MVRTITIKDGTDENVWKILGSVCEDNGDVADGNAWIANPYDSELTEKRMAKAVKEGYGEIVEVEESDDDHEMLKILGLPAHEDIYE